YVVPAEPVPHDQGQAEAGGLVQELSEGLPHYACRLAVRVRAQRRRGRSPDGDPCTQGRWPEPAADRSELPSAAEGAEPEPEPGGALLRGLHSAPLRSGRPDRCGRDEPAVERSLDCDGGGAGESGAED